MNIFKVYCGMHGSKGNALKHLNESLGTSYIHSKYIRWERGEIFPKHATFQFIYLEVLQHVLNTSGIDSEVKQQLEKQLNLPTPR